MNRPTILMLLLGIHLMTACSSSKPATSQTGNPEITETYWRLTELRGKPLGPTAAGKREVSLKLIRDGERIEGFGGCNGFGGRFELQPNSGIRFFNIMGTMMACDETTNENKLLDALRETDNYIHTGKHLILNKGKKAPLARFEAVYYR